MYPFFSMRNSLLRLGHAWRPSGAGEETIAHDAPKRADSVFPTDFLSLGIRPPIVRDWRLVYGPARLCNFDGYFLLEAEPIFFQVKAQNDVTPQSLVTGPYVGKVQICHHV